MRRDQGQIDVPALLDRLPAIQRFEQGEFLRLLLDEPGDAIEKFAPFTAMHLAPDFAVRPARRFDREIHILRTGLGDLRQLLLRRRINGIEIPPRTQSAKLAVDENLVARFNLERIALLESGRIGPAITETEPSFVSGERAPAVIAAGMASRLADAAAAGGLFRDMIRL